MHKTNEERNNYQKTKYHERKAKAKFIKNLLTGIIIILMVGFFLYANSIRETNAKTADTIQGVRDEINSLRKSVQTQFESVGGKLLEQDKKIEGVKQSKAIEKQKQSVALVQNQRPRPSGNCEQWRPLISQYSWNVDTMVAICNAESGGNPNAANWTDSHRTCKGSFGLFQIACMDGIVFDPVKNIQIAYRKYSSSGYTPWTVCRTKVNCI